MKFLVLGMNKISGYKNNVIFKTFKKIFYIIVIMA